MERERERAGMSGAEERRRGVRWLLMEERARLKNGAAPEKTPPTHGPAFSRGGRPQFWHTRPRGQRGELVLRSMAWG